MPCDFNLEKLTSSLNNIEKLSKTIDEDEKINSLIDNKKNKEYESFGY